ncbi:ABC transporter permease [Streptomyces odontomachi]|uniref:ABC transporter permease n=1 Tax=Streptomyces odontomachi TaxID=2944940 RepID=UPI00210DA74F|nr:ABC transporter permease [Streptomyces sp. ODS25]
MKTPPTTAETAASGAVEGGGADGTDEQEPLGLRELLGRNISGVPILALLVIGLSLSTDTFLTGTNLDNLGRQVSIYAIIALGELLVILTAGIDLSVGSVAGLAGVVAAKTVFETSSGGATLGAIVLGLLVGAAAGAVNGALVAFFRMPPFIVTLGMLGAARGLTLVYTHGRTIQPLPDAFQEIAGGATLHVANLIWLTLIIALAVGFALHRTVWGRYVYAVGSNAESARLSGVPVRGVLVSVYALSGLVAGFGGILLASRLGNGVPTSGTGYELQAIAACVIGGASLFGARGTAVGALLGTIIVGLLNNGGTLLAIDPFWLQVVIGALMVIAVGLDQLQSRRPRSASMGTT